MSNKIDELIGTGVIEKTKADYIKEKLDQLTDYTFPTGLELKFNIDRAGNINNFTHKFGGVLNKEQVPKYANKEFVEKILPKKLPDVFFKGDTADIEIYIPKTTLVIITVK